ncbi:hypothetical protein ACIA8O_04045 [Kitasatospora sp. NPDC051853]|uniref:hypothetical protein n=1 Tax=Kitasatospora sp. NPDC051853 TaxID=3364058 RepID=UPI0037B926FB
METNGVPTTEAEAVLELRRIAHSWVDGRHEEPHLLIEAALRSLDAGLCTPSLLHLAALMSAEHDEAPALFDRVMDELGFGFHPPQGYWEGRLALAGWWAAEVTEGWLDPGEGIGLVLENVADAYGVCEELAPVHEVMDWLWNRTGPLPPPQEVDAAMARAARELARRVPLPGRPWTDRTDRSTASGGYGQDIEKS